VEAATIVRDTLAKSLYSCMFNSLIATMNATMHAARKSNLTLGTLDIYGFEILGNNSLEQFLINFVNEKLQALFIDRILRQAQEEYLDEGLDVSVIEYASNLPTCSLIEKKTGGVLALLDEQCAYAAVDGQAKNFVGMIRSQCGKHESFRMPGRFDADTSFKIAHYAGVVSYDASKFIEKNRDELNEELVTMIRMSDVPFFATLLDPPKEELQSLSEDGEGSPSKGAASVPPPTRRRAAGGGMQSGTGSKKRAPTMGQQFKKQVLALMETLGATEPHFIRCLKPNEEKRGDLWDTPRMHEQVVFNGIPENIKIAQGGFVWRVDYEAFIARYKLCSPRTWPVSKEDDLPSYSCQCICEDSLIPRDQYVVGQKSKVFIKEHVYVEALEAKRNAELGRLVLSISKLGRGFAHRKAFQRQKMTANLCAKLWKAKYYQRKFARMKRSAVALQKSGRGMVARQRFKKMVKEEKAARVITTFAQGWKCRKAMPAEWKEKILAASAAVRARKRREMDGVVKAQSLVRRFKARCLLAKAKAASATIQSLARMRTGKREGAARRQARKELVGATRIQSVHRMRVAAARVDGLRKDLARRKLELRSAIAVQNAMRKWKAKRVAAELRQKRKELYSALVVQKAARKWKAKKLLKGLKQNKLELDSCVMVQSAIRMKRDKKIVAVRRQKKLELDSALVVQRAARKWKAKKLLKGLKHNKLEQDSSIKMQSAIRMKRDKKIVAVRRQKKKELDSALALQRCARVWKAKKLLKGLMKAKSEKLAATKIQAVARGIMGRGNAALVLKALREKHAATKIASCARMRSARREWTAQVKAVHVIMGRIRMKLAMGRLKQTQMERELTFKLRAVLGVQVTRIIGGAPAAAAQTIKVDMELTKFSISWNAPVRGKGVTDKGGKRDDEHPMRVSSIARVVMLKGADEDAPTDGSKFPAVLSVQNTDGREWVLAFEDVQTAAMIAAGLRKAAKI